MVLFAECDFCGELAPGGVLRPFRAGVCVRPCVFPSQATGTRTALRLERKNNTPGRGPREGSRLRVGRLPHGPSTFAAAAFRRLPRAPPCYGVT